MSGRNGDPSRPWEDDRPPAVTRMVRILVASSSQADNRVLGAGLGATWQGLREGK